MFENICVSAKWEEGEDEKRDDAYFLIFVREFMRFQGEKSLKSYDQGSTSTRYPAATQHFFDTAFDVSHEFISM